MGPLPTIVGHEDWMKYTAVAFSRRSTELKAVDTAVQGYNRTPSAVTLLTLQQAWDAWKLSKGGGDEWRESSRSRNNYVLLLDNQLRGLGDTDTALGMPAFMEPAMINSRLGVLYLYSKLECNDMFKVIVEGAIDVTTASLDFAVDTAAPELADSKGVKAMDKSSSVLSKGQDKLGQAARLAEEKVRARIKQREGRPQEVSSSVLLNASPPAVPSRLQTLFNTIREKIYSIAQKLLEMARAQWDAAKEKLAWARANPGDAAIEFAPGMLRKLCDFLTGKFLASAAPFIGAGLEIASGVASTIDAGLTKFREWSMSKGVELVIGHPGTIAEAIRRAMWVNVGKGVYETLKGAANLGMEFASQGASSIVSLIWSIVEALAKTIWKLVEISRMKMIFNQAKLLWAERDRPDSLHLKPIQFNAWFKSHALMLPALPVLVLNSGICGDKMHFMKMFKDDSAVVTQASFDAGCRYIDSLKAWGAAYLDDSGFGFTSTDPLVKGLIQLAQSHEADESRGDKVLKAIRGFLG